MAVGVNRWKAGGALEGRKGRYDKNDINDKSPPRPLPLVVFVVYVVGRGTWAGIWTLRKRAKPCCLAALAWVESPPESSAGTSAPTEIPTWAEQPRRPAGQSRAHSRDF